MPITPLKIESILEGFSPTQYFGASGTYNIGLGIDPDLPVGSNTRMSGLIAPCVYDKFSGTEFTSDPMWLTANTKTTNSFAYALDGKLHSFNSSIAMRATDEAGTAFPIQITDGAGNGMAYYNNFIYLAEAADISQYGGMDQGASIAKTENVWTGAKFGKTALNNVTYPTVRGTAIPNHPMHVHSDNSCYVGDTLNGQGIIHRISTTISGGVQGSINSVVVPSAYNALDLPFGFYPTDIESYVTDVVIAAIQTTDSTINQGRAALFFWDPTDTTSFYKQVMLPDPLVTALLNVNGVLYIWSGNGSNGVRLSRYIGGDSVSEIVYQEDGLPPFAGAVDAIGARLVWGGYTSYPTTAAVVMAYGSKNDGLPKGQHGIARSSSTGATGMVRSLKHIQQNSSITPKLIVGWGDDSANGLDSKSTSGTLSSVFRTKVQSLGKEFNLKKLVIPLAGAVDSNTSITVKIYLDDESSSVTLDIINNTNFPSDRKAVYKQSALIACRGYNNFLVEFTWAGTTQTPIGLPISIDVDIFDDEKT